MKTKLLTLTISCLSVFWLLLEDANAQISLLQDYKNNSSATIGTFRGVSFREAGFSALYPIPNTNGKEFWTVSDRGVNIDCKNANIGAANGPCLPTYDKMYAFPSYVPKIHRIRVNGDSIQILLTITMKRPNGTGASGLINPDGLGSTVLEKASTDIVTDCINFNANTVAKDIWGIDSEGIVVDKDGNFWICEEGGPTVWKLNSAGVVLKRYTPYANLTGLQAPQIQDVAIDTCFKYRKNNRGFEGIAITPNGKIYTIIQSSMFYPNQATGENSRVHRILEIDPTTNATKMYVYLNEGVIGASGANQIRLRDWKIGDLTAINNTDFLVLEAAARGTSDVRKIFRITLTGATAVTSASGIYTTGTTIESLVTATADNLTANSIVPVTKTLFMDLLANGWPAVYDKAEGVAIINDSTIAINNDNDYGQTCPLEDGLPIATTTLSHLLTYRLQGNNKIAGYQPSLITLNQGQTGISSSKTPYLQPTIPGASFSSLITAGDVVGGYQMSGIPDGAGGYDNGNGTFTMLVNHEIPSTGGVVRAHGSAGAFVSKWIINKSTLAVESGADLIQTVNTWNSGTSSYVLGTTAFGRFCSADLPPVTAFYNSTTGLGTQERIFMNGEESGAEGRAFGHIATGANAGVTYELPALGKFSWENAIASPLAVNKTVVVGTDDATPGQVYVYVGTKTNTGSDVEKAGLTNGKLYGVAVTGLLTETSASIPTANTAFTMSDLGDVRNMTGATLNANSNTAGVTSFLRPEDGAWDPSSPNDFYFVTTNAFTSPSRLWKLSFTDAANPETGGTITAVLDGTEGQKMMDNLAIDKYGHILIQEDPGNQSYIAKVWQYTIATDKLIQVAHHDSTRFITGAANFLTQDEEASGIFDAEEILGPGKFLMVDQTHYSIPGAIYEGGQLLTFYNPDTYKASLGANPSSSSAPYLLPTIPGASFSSLLTAGDMVGSYQMSGIPDGAGGYDNGNGTFTMLVNHEIPSTGGVVRAHGSAGAFVSKWIINKSTLAVESGADLIQTVNTWNSGTSSYVLGTTAFGRFCSADLPPVTAFYNSTTGLGTQERIFMNGEESGAEGRAFGHIATGANAGVTYELPALGKFSWENAIASPLAVNKTVVVGTDDATPGQVYVYVGTKTNTGSDVEKAGLTNGKLYGVAVTGLLTETSASIPTANTAFTMSDLGDVRNMTGATLNANSNTAGVTSFLRPEDGAWDPSSPNDFYFVTTNAFTSPSRLWKLSFTDAANPETGGTITAVLDGTEGQKMMDNLAIDKYGHILIQEDPGNQSYIAKVWQYTIATDKLIQVAHHDSTRFITGAANFLTQDEEASGIFDAEEILGPGKFLMVDQTHYSIPGAIYEGGQLLTFYNPDTYNSNPEISVQGNSITILDGDISVSSTDNTDLGTVNLGSTLTKTFVINNAGPGALKVRGISFAGTNAAEFSLITAPTFPLSIAASSTQSITVQFAPTSTGTRTATLKIVSNDFSEGEFDFMVQGTSTSPEIKLQGNTIDIAKGDITPSATDNTDFGSITTGSTLTKIFTIQNTGTGSLSVSGITFAGTNSAEFTLVSAPTFPVAIAASGSQSITVQFAPLASGIRSATCTIANSDADEGSYDFALQGTATSPEINVQGNSVSIVDGDVTPSISDATDFGSASTTTSVAKSFTIQNTGSANLSVTAIGFTGTNASEFTLISGPTLPLTITAGNSETINVKFAPLAIGTRTSTITITNSDSDEGAYDFSLQGTATAVNGVQSSSDNSYIKLYPNPTGDLATISMLLEKAEMLTLKVLDLEGKVVLETIAKQYAIGEQQILLNTATLQGGVYTVEVSSETTITRIKAVVIH